MGEKEFGYEFDPLNHAVIGAAIDVHRELGVGYLKTVYHEALCIELNERKIAFEKEYPIGVSYKGRIVGEGRVGIFVEKRLVVELKAVEAILPIHTAQVLSYLKATRCKYGLLINFTVPVLKQGIRRIVLS
ncbi:MAG: GxxExxY protein [Anaerolineae bacterium]